MSREIKFRCWDKAEKRMLYRGVFDLNWYATPYNDENGCNCVRGITPDDRPKVELMQYTGLKDKNGVEIYEGDIVQFEKHRGEIKYYTGNVGGGEFRIEPNGDRNFYDEMGVRFSWNEIEVIGNIYENPELLESKDE